MGVTIHMILIYNIIIRITVTFILASRFMKRKMATRLFR